jgi:integrase/recombinase XerD
LPRWDKGKLLNTRSVQNIVRKYVGTAGKSGAISLHFIRHTVDTNIALNEAPLLIIQQFLGHYDSDPKTTLRYIRRAEEVATRAYRYNTPPSDPYRRAAGVLLLFLASGATPLVPCCL